MKLKALTTFDHSQTNPTFVREGNSFEVKNLELAKNLIEKGFAKEVKVEEKKSAVGPVSDKEVKKTEKDK